MDNLLKINDDEQTINSSKTKDNKEDDDPYEIKLLFNKIKVTEDPTTRYEDSKHSGLLNVDKEHLEASGFSEKVPDGKFEKSFNDYIGMDSETKKEKRKFLNEIKRCKEKFPHIIDNSTSYSLSDELEDIKDYYIELNKSINIRNKLESYLLGMKFFFIMVENVFTNYVGIDMYGYADSQISSTTQDSYVELLLELCEKNYVPQDKRYPVELRLLFTMGLQSIFFVIPKILSSGNNDMNRISDILKKSKHKISPPSKFKNI